MLKRVFLVMSLLMLTNVQAGELYRSIDKDGKVHYSDTPLEGSEDFERLKLPDKPATDDNLPYETKRAMENFPVTLYSSTDCGSACLKAREMLNKRGIPFAEKSLTTREAIEAFRKDSGDNQVPALTIGRTWLKGFLDEQWNNELDFAGYPKKVISYSPRPAASAVAPADTSPAPSTKPY